MDTRTDTSTSSRHSPAVTPEPLRFTGSGAEYFRIWIVNLALTVITFGIYSAWAKVRRMQYFYRNTQIAGSSFDYHGTPIAILKGRLIAFGLLGIANATYKVNPLLGALLFLPVAGVLPWLLVRSLKFRLHSTSWRGVRFGFDGTVAGGYRAFLLWPLVTVLSLGLLWPAAHCAIKSYQHSASRFGKARFAFAARTSDFYRVYAWSILLFVVLPVAALFALSFIVSGATGSQGGRPPSGVLFAMAVAFVTMYLGFLTLGIAIAGRIQNLVWRSTTLGQHRFSSDVRVGRLAWITLSNLVLTVVTLGLYRPFAAVRVARYRVESMSLLAAGSLDDFVGTQGGEIGAFGEELGEFLDIDIAL